MLERFKQLFGKKQERPGYWNPEDHPELMNPELQEAISAVTEGDTPERRRRLYEVILSLNYCVCTSGSAESGRATVLATQNNAGEVVLAAFSDPAALRRWNPDSEGMLVMPAQELCAMTLKSGFAGIALNPAGPAGGNLKLHEVDALAEGRMPKEAEGADSPQSEALA